MIDSPLSVLKTEAHKFYSNIYISLYIPKTNVGTGSFKSRNRVRFCRSLMKIEKKLLDKGISFTQVRVLLKPVEHLVDNNIWNRNCPGVAIFVKGEKVKVFACNTPINQMEEIGDSFFINPLMNFDKEEYKKIIDSLSLLDYKKPNYLSYYQ